MKMRIYPAIITFLIISFSKVSDAAVATLGACDMREAKIVYQLSGPEIGAAQPKITFKKEGDTAEVPAIILNLPTPQNFHTGKAGETYNVGGHNEKNNLEIVDAICTILDQKCPRADKASYKQQIVFVKDRPGHDKRYAIDATKLSTELGWKADENFASGIVKTVDWYLAKLNRKAA